jgi:uncharacterized protein
MQAMAQKIRIKIGQIEAEAEFNDSRTAEAIWKALPIERPANLWGEEIYFTLPIKAGLEKGQEVVQVGDLGYWPPGSAFCIFFGKTPMSSEREIRPASAVSVLGRITSDISVFKKVISGDKILISKRD